MLADARIPERAGQPFLKGAGCVQCHDSGFQGRIGIYEVMEVTSPVRRLVHQGASTQALRAVLDREGFTGMRAEGVRLAQEGHTSLEEEIRVTKSDDIAEDEPVTAGRLVA